jgi:hypothetical protein
MAYLGTFHIDDYVGIPAATHRFSSGAAYAPTALTYSIYEEATTTGIDEDVDMTVASPFDSITGCYWVRRQLTAAAGFEEGKNYLVVVKATVDSVAAIQMHTFQVEAATVNANVTQISGDSTAADNAESFFDGTGYAGTNNVIPTVTTLTGHTAQTGDAYAVVAHADYGNAKLVRSTTPANTLTVDASHQALALTNAVTNDAITAAAIANGAIDAATFAAGAIDADAIADGAIDNGALAADAISAAKIAADVTTELQSGLATATAALILATPANKLTTDASGRVEVSGTKNTLDDLNDAAAAPSAADIKTALEADGSKLDHLWEMTEDDGGVRRMTANALEEAPVDGAAPTVGDIADAVWDEALAGHAGLGTAGATLSAASAPSAGDVADAVWDEALAGHLGAGTTGAALSAAGAAGDPWTTALPGAYADGTAGDIIGNLVTDIGALTPAVAISATTAASVSTGALAVRTYHSLSQAISSTYAGNLNAATKLWLAVKAEKDDTDAQAVIFIEKTAGLTVLAGAAYTTVAHGSLTVGGLAGAWTVTVALNEVATGLLTPYADGMLWAECKALVAGSTVAVWDGVCDVARGIVVAVS